MAKVYFSKDHNVETDTLIVDFGTNAVRVNENGTQFSDADTYIAPDTGDMILAVAAGKVFKFYIDGVYTGYIDSTGWHAAP